MSKCSVLGQETKCEGDAVDIDSFTYSSVLLGGTGIVRRKHSWGDGERFSFSLHRTPETLLEPGM
jgi:hypothetical protein